MVNMQLPKLSELSQKTQMLPQQHLDKVTFITREEVNGFYRGCEKWRSMAADGVAPSDDNEDTQQVVMYCVSTGRHGKLQLLLCRSELATVVPRCRGWVGEGAGLAVEARETLQALYCKGKKCDASPIETLDLFGSSKFCLVSKL